MNVTVIDIGFGKKGCVAYDHVVKAIGVPAFAHPVTSDDLAEISKRRGPMALPPPCSS